ncbi:MAG TPA: MDR family MFS transporter [Dehalococcoidia bacterium]|nr:MDR family MFS transporter [Dehalococcoidia bacterium]
MSSTAAAPRTSRFDPRWLPLGATVIGSFMSVLDTNIVNVALPDILQHFHSDLGTGQLVITFYVMALAVVIPLSGFLGERVGMKRLYMFTLAAFTAGSALCGLAWNVESLIFFRVLQGLGGGMLQPLGIALVFTMITPLERPQFIALLGIPALLAPLIGPTVGGYLVEYVSWRAIFLINVPVGILDIVLTAKLVKETIKKTDTKLDAGGFGFAAVAFPSLLLSMSIGVDAGWTSPQVLALFGIGVVCLFAFIRTELRHHDPMLRLRLFALPHFRLSLFVHWTGIFSLFGLNLVIPLYLERVHGLDAATTGEVLLPTGFAAFLTMNIAGKVYNSIGPRPIIMTGLAILAATTFAWAEIGRDTSMVWLMVLASGRGFGMGMFGQIIQVVAYNAVDQPELPRATALVNVCQRLTTAFSTAMLSSVLIVGLAYAGGPAGTSIAEGDAPIGAMEQTFRYAFWLMTGLSIFGIFMASRLRDYVLEEYRRNSKKAEAVASSSAVPSLASAEPTEGG